VSAAEATDAAESVKKRTVEEYVVGDSVFWRDEFGTSILPVFRSLWLLAISHRPYLMRHNIIDK
jgi:hypothetical protein